MNSHPAGPEQVVVSGWYDEIEIAILFEFNPAVMRRSWASMRRNVRDHPQFYKDYVTSYPVLARELVNRYDDALNALEEIKLELEAALAAAPRKSLDDFAEELGWSVDDH